MHNRYIFSKASEASILDDKNLYQLYFHDVKQPQTIAHKVDGLFLDEAYSILSEDEVLKRCQLSKAAIIKPAINSMAGAGIHLWENEDLSTLRHYLHSRENLIIQEIVHQHQILANLNSSCVNTLRLVTLIWNDKVNVVTSVLIIGGKDSKTNHLHRGGLVCGIEPTGKLKRTAFDGQLNHYEMHPNGMIFEEVCIPNYDQCVEMVISLATRLSRVSKLTSWDLTIDEEGNPILIEANLSWGGAVQIAGGPVFGDLTKEILDRILIGR